MSDDQGDLKNRLHCGDDTCKCSRNEAVARIEALEAEVHRLTEQNKQLDAKFEKAADIIERFQTAYDDAKSQLTAYRRLDESLQYQRSEVERLTEENARLRDALSAMAYRDAQIDKLQAEMQRLTAYVDAFRREERRADDAARDRDDARAEAQRLTEERDAVKAELDLTVKKVITCGVAASHSDANLTRTGAYADKWDSQQAEAVRALRAERDALLEKFNKPVVLSEWQALVAERDALQKQWIPVSERLPNYGESVLLYRPDAEKTNDPVYALRARQQGHSGPFEFRCVAVPSHWISLPPPPDAAMAAQPGGEL